MTEDQRRLRAGLAEETGAGLWVKEIEGLQASEKGSDAAETPSAEPPQTTVQPPVRAVPLVEDVTGLDELEKLARELRGSTWEIIPPGFVVDSKGKNVAMTLPLFARYIAAACPANIMALISAGRMLTVDLRKVTAELRTVKAQLAEMSAAVDEAKLLGLEHADLRKHLDGILGAVDGQKTVDATALASVCLEHEERASSLASTQRALAEVLAFVADANNTEKPAVVAWHRDHAAPIRDAAERFGRTHMLVGLPTRRDPEFALPLLESTKFRVQCRADACLERHKGDRQEAMISPGVSFGLLLMEEIVWAFEAAQQRIADLEAEVAHMQRETVVF